MEFKVIEGLPDYKEIISLINAEWPKEFGEKSDNEKIAEMIDSHSIEKDRTKFLYDGIDIIGFYRYTSWPRDARQTDSAHTYDIAVLPERQRQGLGVMLMNDMIEDCRLQGFKRLLSRSFKNNEASIALHERFDFHRTLETADSIVWEVVFM